MDMNKNKSMDIAFINEQYGKIPPQAIDIEEAVLAAYMLEENAFLMNPILPEVFYKKENQIICNAIKELSLKNIAIDLLTVTQYLRDNDLLDQSGGVMYITELTGKISGASHLKFHKATVEQMHQRREYIRKASELQNKAFDASLDIDVLDGMASSIALMSMNNSSRSDISYRDITVEIKEVMEANQWEDVKTNGLDFGLWEADRLINSIQGGNLVILAAYPGDGKTSAALQFAKKQAAMNIPGAIASLEMTPIELGSRILSQDTGLGAKYILSQKLSGEEAEIALKGIKETEDYPIYFNYKGGAHINDICNFFRAQKIKNDIKYGIVDYIQLGRADGGSREEKTAEFTSSLKGVARELEIPIIALSQFSRKKERHEAPQIEDLKYSGAIEADADLVLISYIPANHEIDRFDFKGVTYDTHQIAVMDIAKNRNGSKGKVLVKFIGEKTLFENYNPEPYESDDTPPNTNFYEKDKDNDRPF